MSKMLSTLGAVLLVAMMVAWVGAWGPLASAASKKAPTPVPETGQTTSFAPGDDGDLHAGVPFPTPRFTDNHNGTVTDNLTGLVWLKDANCFGSVDWLEALKAANTLAHGSCGLTDHSQAGDWRLPNIRELLSLIDYGFAFTDGLTFPALSNAAGTARWTEGDAFSKVQPDCYVSSTSPLTVEGDHIDVFRVLMRTGRATENGGSCGNFVWPVRGGK